MISQLLRRQHAVRLTSVFVQELGARVDLADKHAMLDAMDL
jgi:hypothetical protein